MLTYPSSNVKGMMEEIAKYGTPNVQKDLCDWTKPNLAGWKLVLLENALHRFSSTATQSAEFERFGNDHRRDGYSLQRKGGRLLHSFQR